MHRACVQTVPGSSEKHRKDKGEHRYSSKLMKGEHIFTQNITEL